MQSQSNTETIPATARVWVYMADREFNAPESSEIINAVQQFTQEWAAHGKALASAGELRYNRFLVLTVDEGFTAASGCSIDTSVRFIKELEEHYQVDFFNRMLVAYKDASGEVKTTSMHNLSQLKEKGDITEKTIVFNNLVSNKQELDNTWEVALGESIYARIL